MSIITLTKNGDFTALETLINNSKQNGKELDLNEVDDEGKTSIYHAANLGFTPIIELLLKENIDVNKTDYSNSSPLGVAAANGHYCTVEYLLTHRKKDIQLNLGDKFKSSPLLLACMNGQAEVARLLLEHNADVNAVDDDSNSALHYAVEQCDEELIKILLDANIDVNKTGKSSYT